MKDRKALKAAYKEMKFKMGAFQIRNLSNGKLFVGSSANLDAIWNRHRFQLNMGSHRNTELQKEWNTFKEENFVFEILEELPHRDDTSDYSEELSLLETFYLEKLSPYNDRGYHQASRRT
ncbi:MAG: GIY-YIG nuclease family protein [Cyanothece sp. SIO1E1]|nr:GIY-YIG nuclease family protein [Cyanothece sp. SIO1E1]